MSFLTGTLSNVLANLVLWVFLGLAFWLAGSIVSRRFNEFFGLSNGRNINVYLSNLYTREAPVLPWVIDSVFLFERDELLATLTARGVKIGVATSVRKPDWEKARIFPSQPTTPLQLSDLQLAQLTLFSSQAAETH